MSSGKFNTIGIEGDSKGLLRKTSHPYPYEIIVPGIVDKSNNFTQPVIHPWPAELSYVLRPLFKEYRINSDLSWTLFTARNKNIATYISLSNPCCCICKDNGSPMTFILSKFDNISKAFVSKAKIQGKIIALYLSATRTNDLHYEWRDCLIFTPESEAISKANELNLMIGVATLINDCNGPVYRFNALSNIEAWDTSPTFRLSWL